MDFDLGRWLPEFPVREEHLYLDHAAVSPLPRPVAEAMRRRIGEKERSGHLSWDRWMGEVLTCRHLGSRLVGCTEEDVSLVASTSQGLSLVAEGLGLGQGDEVLVGTEEFAANAAPWLNLQRLGVRVIRYPQPGGRIDPEEVARHMGPATRVLAVSWVAFHTGWIAPLTTLAGLCRDRGVALVVDAIQGLGVLPMDMRRLGVDAVVAAAHKWLLGPEGVALLATSEALRQRLRPVLAGWRNVEISPKDYTLTRLELPGDGRRFEPGSFNGTGVSGLAAALDLFFSVGLDVIQARIEMLNRLLARVLIAHGWEVVSPGAGHPVAGIVAARHPAVPPREVVSRLAERHIVCSVRQGLVRFSPHFYITRGEIEAFDRILEKAGL